MNRPSLRAPSRLALPLPIAFILLIAQLGCGGADGSGSANQGPRPNIILVLFDDMNDWVEPLGGHPDAKTPNLQRLAEMGVSFSNAHCDATACNPSRTALLTGLRPTTTGVYKNGQPYMAAVSDRPTLMEAFSAAGYRTLGAGKVFHSWGPTKLVWDEYLRKEDDPVSELSESAGLAQLPHFRWGPVEAAEEAMDDVQVALQAKAWLESPQPDPFFMALGIYRPHLPWTVPSKYFDLYPLEEITIPVHPKEDLKDLPPAALTRLDREAQKAIARSQRYPRAVQSYLASLSFADAVLGRILDALEASPYRDDTILVVASDHGLHLGEKKHWGKYTLWERATHVPLIIYGKDLAGNGTPSPRPVTLVDLYPTLLDLAGLEPVPNLDGVSLVPLLEDPQRPWKQPALTTYPGKNYAVRNERWRYIRYRNGDEELYDHDSDPAEQRNLAADPDLAKIKADLGAFIPAVTADNAPITFYPNDLQGTVKHLVRFYEPEQLIRALEPVAERRQKRREQRKAAAAAKAEAEAQGAGGDS